MNNWIAVDCDIADDDKTKAVARGAGLTLNECVGALVRVFGRMRRKAEKGSLATISDDTINEWAGLASDHTFAPCFVAHLCNSKRLVLAWMNYNGKMIAKSKKDVARIRNYRQRKKLERADVTRTVRVLNGKRTRNATRTEQVGATRSPNPTQPNPTATAVGVGGGDGGGAFEDARHTPPEGEGFVRLERPVVDFEEVKRARAEFDAELRKANGATS